MGTVTSNETATMS